MAVLFLSFFGNLREFLEVYAMGAVIKHKYLYFESYRKRLKKNRGRSSNKNHFKKRSHTLCMWEEGLKLTLFMEKKEKNVNS